MQAKTIFMTAWVSFCAFSTFSQAALQNRKPYAAGRFYTDKPAELISQLEQLFSNSALKSTEKTPLAIIVPHAGYVYSGEVAASAYKQIDPKQKFERIFIIGSSHTTTFSGASVYCNGNYETPLGTVQVDMELAKKLIAENKLLKCNPEAHLHEHSIEVQLPFLQYFLKTDLKIVPIIIGSSTNETAQNLAEILKPYLNEKNLFVISSDFSHYPGYNDAKKVDQLTAEAIQTNNPSKLLATLENNYKRDIDGLSTSLCGWSSVLTLLYMTKKLPEININLVQYKNSGDKTFGDKDRVVGYYAISFIQRKSAIESAGFSLSNDEKKYLLKLAHETISEYIRKETVPKVDQSVLSPNLKKNCGAFVTIYKNGILRGCIGRFDPDEPLWKVVQSMAVSAATRDYRFDQVLSAELSKLNIEISVLTPLKRIKSADEIILGKHGIYLKKGDKTGTFLPQVATQAGWSKEELLGHCAEDKAQFGWDGWKTAELYTYEALVFGEEEK